MSLIQHIGDSIAAFWHADLAPWLKTLLTNVAHHEVDALLPLATTAVNEIAKDFMDNAGNISNFAALAGQVLAKTAQQSYGVAVQVGGASLLTAVTAAIAAHPGITAAVEAAKVPAPANTNSLGALAGGL